MIKFQAIKVVGNEVTLIGNSIRIVLTRSGAVSLLEMLQEEKYNGNLSLDGKDIRKSLEERKP